MFVLAYSRGRIDSNVIHARFPIRSFCSVSMHSMTKRRRKRRGKNDRATAKKRKTVYHREKNRSLAEKEKILRQADEWAEGRGLTDRRQMLREFEKNNKFPSRYVCRCDKEVGDWKKAKELVPEADDTFAGLPEGNSATLEGIDEVLERQNKLKRGAIAMARENPPDPTSRSPGSGKRSGAQLVVRPLLHRFLLFLVAQYRGIPPTEHKLRDATFEVFRRKENGAYDLEEQPNGLLEDKDAMLLPLTLYDIVDKIQETGVLYDNQTFKHNGNQCTRPAHFLLFCELEIRKLSFCGALGRLRSHTQRKRTQTSSGDSGTSASTAGAANKRFLSGNLTRRRGVLTSKRGSMHGFWEVYKPLNSPLV